GPSVDLVEELLRSGDGRLPGQGGADEMGGLAWSVAQLLGHDLEDGASQAIFVKVGRRGRGGLATHHRFGLRQGELGDLGGQLRRARSVARQLAGDGMPDHRGQHDLVADSRCLDHHAVIVLPAQSSAEQRDHLVTGASKWPPYSPNTGAPKWPPYSPNTGASK